MENSMENVGNQVNNEAKQVSVVEAQVAANNKKQATKVIDIPMASATRASTIRSAPNKLLEMLTVVKRNGMLVPFRRDRIVTAIEAAFRATRQIPILEPMPQDLHSSIHLVSDSVIQEVLTQASRGACLTVEGLQDIVEKKLMECGFHEVARNYIVYREEHKQIREDSPRNIKIFRRDGSTQVRFNPMKIASAIERAFRASEHVEGSTPQEIIDAVNLLTNKVVQRVVQISKAGTDIHVELIQDEVERQMMAEGFYKVAKDFILYRAERSIARAREEAQRLEAKETEAPEAPADTEAAGKEFKVTAKDGSLFTMTERDLRRRVAYACRGLEDRVSSEEILRESLRNFYENIRIDEIDTSNMMAARAKIEKEPAYSFVAARLLLDVIYRETMGVEANNPQVEKKHQAYLAKYLERAVAVGRIDPKLMDFDLNKLSRAIQLERDLKFTYLGLQTLYDRYLIHHEDRRLETPQLFWMRVAMGLAINEGQQKNERAIEFYNVLSQFLFTSSTPTLFNSGTLHPQMSSCYLTTVMDDLRHIFKSIADNAQLSKWAGGLGNDWTNVRATGARIKGTNGKSQGIIPFLKVANDTLIAVNQGGKRKGAGCAYLESWHYDIEDFLELRKNTGDDRRRAHDMNTANWIPDLFMKRVTANGQWTLFTPSDVPDLHDLYGQAFEKRYAEYEKMTETGEIKLFKRIEAVGLWRKMLSFLFETGHPWITFKDPSNLRSPQDHVGVVHSSNLCTEILLNTSVDETAVCNLGSINLLSHISTAPGAKAHMDEKLLASTVRSAVRMLDNVIDINFYPTDEARNANIKHRPIGLGIMGFQDALYRIGVSYASPEAVSFADESMELISYYAILASTELAKERGTYSTFKGSKWDRGLLPIDTLQILKEQRGPEYLDIDLSSKLDWSVVRAAVKNNGMRNSNTMAIAPTATISNITGVTQSIEPSYKHLYAKSNLSGEFTVQSVFLVEKLKSLGLWDEDMIDDLKYFDGSILEIDRVPTDIKRLFLTAFEIEPEWLIECGSRRQKWIDMGQSLNLYIAEPSGKKLHDMYMLAWKKGLKTTYYLRSLGATQIEKSTTDINKRGLQPRWMKNKSASANVKVERAEVVEASPQAKPAMPKAMCSLDGDCESCQ